MMVMSESFFFFPFPAPTAVASHVVKRNPQSERIAQAQSPTHALLFVRSQKRIQTEAAGVSVCGCCSLDKMASFSIASASLACSPNTLRTSRR